MKKVVIIIFILLLSSIKIYSDNARYVTHKAKKGDGITTILVKYNLQVNKFNVDFFKENNKTNLNSDFGLYIGKEYFLPIRIFKYDGKSIRSSLEINDLEFAKKIQSYNMNLFRKKIKNSDYKIDQEIWLPLSFDNEKSNENSEKITNKIDNKKIKENIPRNIVEPLFGEKYKNVTVSSNSLSNCIFYLISGHGGPDPGAIGYKDGNELHEDEYAYDVTLRFARKLMENGAEVYIIVQDENDGIRDEKYLNNSSNEYHINKKPIPLIQKDRLSERIIIINDLYNQNKSKNKKQYCVEIHVDSRYTGQKVDIFFYYQNANSEGKKLANALMTTIKEKYDKAQPGRGYQGSVSQRGLYTLRKALPTTVFIEIGNIQNLRDQIRIIESNNRQAIANWLCDGFIYNSMGK